MTKKVIMNGRGILTLSDGRKIEGAFIDGVVNTTKEVVIYKDGKVEHIGLIDEDYKPIGVNLLNKNQYTKEVDDFITLVKEALKDEERKIAFLNGKEPLEVKDDGSCQLLKMLKNKGKDFDDLEQDDIEFQLLRQVRNKLEIEFRKPLYINYLYNGGYNGTISIGPSSIKIEDKDEQLDAEITGIAVFKNNKYFTNDMKWTYEDENAMTGLGKYNKIVEYHGYIMIKGEKYLRDGEGRAVYIKWFIEEIKGKFINDELDFKSPVDVRYADGKIKNNIFLDQNYKEIKRLTKEEIEERKKERENYIKLLNNNMYIRNGYKKVQDYIDDTKLRYDSRVAIDYIIHVLGGTRIDENLLDQYETRFKRFCEDFKYYLMEVNEFLKQNNIKVVQFEETPDLRINIKLRKGAIEV